MNTKLSFFIAAIAVAATVFIGCSTNKSADPAPQPVPSGTFSGVFRLLHRSQGAIKTDTTKVNLQVVLGPMSAYKVSGDTATVHAGSMGQYSVAGNAILFQDATFPKGGTSAKIHLNGFYQYYYDGSSVLQMVYNSADTASLQYDLKKVN